MLIIFYLFVIQIRPTFQFDLNFLKNALSILLLFKFFCFDFVIALRVRTLIAEKGIREITTHCLLFEKCLQIGTTQLALNFSVCAYLSIYNLCLAFYTSP